MRKKQKKIRILSTNQKTIFLYKVELHFMYYIAFIFGGKMGLDVKFIIPF